MKPIKRRPSRPQKRERGSLLVGSTGEPLQPVRLYGHSPDEDERALGRRLRELRCIQSSRRPDQLDWMYRDEAAHLDFGAWSGSAQPKSEPIVLGTWQFLPRGPVLAVRSFHRALLAARFFGPRLGPRFAFIRMRQLNRWVGANEIPGRDLSRLDALLDHHVTVIDPQAGERELRELVEASRGSADREAFVHEQLVRRDRPLPDVEDCPLYPEEESPDFRDLDFLLRLRFVLACDHWQGRTERTLRDVIVDALARAGSKP
jgi:hypothetical protein